MYTYRIIIVILGLIFYPVSTMLAQINVYTQGCNTLTTAQYNNGSTFNAGCYELPSTLGQTYATSTQKEVVAEDHILLEEDVEFTASGSGQADLRIEELPYEVVAFSNSLNNIKKLDKFEIGLTLPEFYSQAVKNFINESGSPQINPFLSDKVEIIAEFYTEVEIFGQTIPITKKRHGYFTTDITRDISGFDSLYNHPYWDSADKFGGQDYDSLGGGWSEAYSDYPFRIRFAPPKVGEWTCKIQVNLLSGTTVYETPPFTFNVVDSNIPGYLRAGKNGRWLKRDGVTYQPIGPNYPFAVRNGCPLLPNDGVNQSLIMEPQYYGETVPIAAYEQYLRYMDTLAMNGANYFRMIMNPWAQDIEYEKLGDYSDRMHIAKEMDLILERAQNNGMLIHWNLMVHYGLQTFPFGISQWDWSFDHAPNDTVYFTPTNGYCYNDELNLSSPIEFFDNPQAIKYYKERIRYIVARWGYSPTVGMFEHLSEIDQVGTEHDTTGAIAGTNQYRGQPANQQKIFNWHGVMSNYMKDELEVPQLLTLSYTLSHNTENDPSFWHGNIDVISVNNYNYATSDIFNFYRNEIPYKVADDQQNNSDHYWGNYNKPLIFSESGAHEVWGCDNFIETRRNIWQNMFYGVAATFDWEIENMHEDMKDLSIYERVKEFMDGVDLEGGNWHSGIVKKKNDGTLMYKPSYLDDCIRDDELADVVYLRSGDEEKAMGVITNRRANYYTLGEGDCTSDSNAPKHSDEDFPELFGDYKLQNYGSVAPISGDSRLRIRNMALGFLGAPKKYKIKYYSPYDQLNPIKEETRWAPQLTLEFPELDTLDIVLFEVSPNGENFKNAEGDTSSTDRNKPKLSNKNEEQKLWVVVYPNPNDGSFVVMLENPDEVKSISVFDNMGRKIDSKSMVYNKNRFNNLNLASGVYTVKVIFKNKVIMKKIMIN